jgi:hypothetical protein
MIVTVEEDILFCAFRYALGRMTYITAVVGDCIIENKANLSQKIKSLIVKEIANAIDENRAGMEGVDVPSWRRVMDSLLEA